MIKIKYNLIYDSEIRLLVSISRSLLSVKVSFVKFIGRLRKVVGYLL